MKKIIHINQHKIKSNRKNNESHPVITVKTYKSNDYASEVLIVDENGQELARVVYRPDDPLSCGAHCWVETSRDVILDPVRRSK